MMNSKLIKLYCGGRFYFDCRDEEYVNQASLDYRAVLLGDVDKLLYPKETYAINEHVEYLGPFYYECESQKADDIVAKERQMLDRCTDAVFIMAITSFIKWKKILQE